MNDLIESKKNQALALLRSNRLAEAKILYRQICQAIPREAESWNLLGAVHGMLGEFQEAEACCRKVIALQPDAVGTYNNLGNALKFQGRVREAEECYRQAINLMPGYAEAHNNLGNLLKDQGESQKAEVHYRQAVASAPNYADAHSNLGLILRDQDNLEDAIASYRRALQLDPNHRDALYNLGHALSENNESAAAAAIFEQLVRAHPQDSVTWAVLGTTYAQIGEFDKALASCQQAIVRRPDYADAYFRYGSVYQLMGQCDKAKEMYERALAIEPDMVSARYFLATLSNEAVPRQSPAEYVLQCFDEYAHKFDQHLLVDLAYRAPELLHRAVMRAIGNDRKELELLDLGCGTGLGGAQFRNIAKRLTGVDLSPRMIQKARERGIYDELFVGDLLIPMCGSDARYDLIIATDVFIYIGDLSSVFAAAKFALRPGGFFAISTELEKNTESYVLRGSGRYAHSVGYIRTLASAAGLMEIGVEQAIIRHELGKPTEGNIFVLQKPVRDS